MLSAAGTYGQQPAASQLEAGDASGVRDSIAIIPGDILDIHVLNLPEMDQLKVRVTDSGEVPLIVSGPVKIEGLTTGDAGQAIAAAYMSRHILKDAHVNVTLEDESYAFHAVTVFGYVVGAAGATNGISLPLPAPRPLLTVLAMAGGLSDRASRTVTIQRRDRSVRPFSVSIPTNPDELLANQPMIYPGDIVDVPRAGLVYILGDVGQPHGVVMQEAGEISLMQALSLAGSTLPNSSLRNVMIFRKADGDYKQLKVNVGKISKGKDPDVALKAEDVIWVPFSYGKNILVNASSIIAALGSASTEGIIINH
jgi:polysaccharide export outer membrane protein